MVQFTASRIPYDADPLRAIYDEIVLTRQALQVIAAATTAAVPVAEMSETRRAVAVVLFLRMLFG